MTTKRVAVLIVEESRTAAVEIPLEDGETAEDALCRVKADGDHFSLTHGVEWVDYTHDWWVPTSSDEKRFRDEIASAHEHNASIRDGAE